MNFDDLVREILTKPYEIKADGENIHIQTQAGTSVIIDKSNRVPFFSSLRKSIVIDGFIIGVEKVAYSKEWARIAAGPIGNMIQNIMTQDEIDESVRLGTKLN